MVRFSAGSVEVGPKGHVRGAVVAMLGGQFRHHVARGVPPGPEPYGPSTSRPTACRPAIPSDPSGRPEPIMRIQTVGVTSLARHYLAGRRAHHSYPPDRTSAAGVKVPFGPKIGDQLGEAELGQPSALAGP